MKSRFCVLFLMLLSSLAAQNVRLKTNVGDIEITLLPQFAPRTVQNFLNYANRGAYNGSIFHRLVRGFVLQGGGYRLENGRPVEIPQDPPVVNEFRVSNTAYTIAMAKLGDNPNSATNQWFINLGDNRANLNNQNGGFTVFAVVDQLSRPLVDRLGQLQIVNAGEPFDTLPVVNAGGDPLVIEAVEVLRGAPTIAEGGVISASNYGAYRYAAPGSFIEIYGTDLAVNSRTWETRDFTDGRAPTSLENVSVLINGVNAFVYAVTPTQLNVQVPAVNIPTTGNVPVEVRIGNNVQISNTVQLAMRPTAPGLLAPDFLRDNERLFAIATRQDGSLVTPQNGGAVKGETLTFYGVGFGAVTGAPLAGQIVAGLAPLIAPVEFRLHDVPAPVTYAGLAPGFVGLYQFNVTLPADLESRDHELTVTVGGEPIAQRLFLRVR